MTPLDNDIARSLRSSSVRDRILLAADRRKRAYLAQLAEDACVDASLARDAIFGRRPGYAPDLSLVHLDLMRTVDANATEFEITPRGAEAARVRRERGTRRL